MGPQYWWPGESRFEVIVGAVLTQNTSWKNVEKAIANLKKSNLMNIKRLTNENGKNIATLIRPSGFYNIKTRRLKNLLNYLKTRFGSDLRKASCISTGVLRKELLAVNGIGKETADSILLYAFNRPVFVVDSYTKRVLARHKMLRGDEEYDEISKIFYESLPEDAGLFNEYHALIVRLCKEFCYAVEPLCGKCLLKKL